MPRFVLPILLLCLLIAIPSAQSGELEFVTVNHRPAAEVQQLLIPLLEGDERVIADGSNLIIRASPSRLAELKALVAKLDSKLHNLLISVRQGQGLSAKALNAAANVQLRVPVGQPGQTSARVRGQIEDREVQRSEANTQTLRTLEGQPALVQAGESRPVQGVVVYNNNGYPQAANTTTMVNATTGFAVTPRLAGDEVLLDVAPWSDRMRGNGTIATQSAATQIRAKLGEWVEIGALQRSVESQQSGILSRGQQTRSSDSHILVKVEIID